MANGIMLLVATVMLVLPAALVMAAIPGPNDLRYPDYIVNPPVSCVIEGSFPHPRNCSWYFRCVDRMKVGYFWTYHFECEPGTVFSDELDQCVHPFEAPYSCKQIPTTEPPMACTGVPGTCKEYDVCLPAKTKKTMCSEIHCPLRVRNLGCGDGYAFDMAIQECAPIPTDAELCDSLICRAVPGTCKDYEICGTNQKKTLCKEIFCPLRQPNLSCGNGYLYDINEKICAKIPASCDTDVPIVEKANITCSFNGQIPKAQFVLNWFCKDIHLCEANNYQGKTKLCSAYYECESIGAGFTVHKRSCPRGFLYSFDSAKCEPSPTDEERC